MDRTSTIKQLNCTREEALCCEPATETPPEALENKTTQTVPKNRRDCGCDRHQTEANYTQLDTEGAVDVGFQTQNHRVKETGSHSESESSSLQAECCMEATTSETKCCKLTVESNTEPSTHIANTEPSTAEIQSTNDVERKDNDHHSGESISAHSCEHFSEMGLLQQEENTEDGDESGVQNGDEDGENARNCGDHLSLIHISEPTRRA